MLLAAIAVIAVIATAWPTSDRPTPRRTPAGVDHPAPQWFGVYLEDRKIGHATLAIRPSRSGEPASIVADTTMSVRFAGGGQLDIVTARYYDRTPPHRLIELHTRETTADGSSEIRAVRRPNGMQIYRSIDGKPAIGGGAPASGETLETFTAQYALEPSSVAVGDRFSLVELDVDSGRDRSLEVAVVDRRSQLSFGARVEVVELAIRRAGDQIETRTLIAAGGKTLRAVVGQFSFRAQDRQAARSGVEGLDPLASVVAIDERLGDPGRITALTATLTSSAGARRVAIEVGAGEAVLEVERAAALAATAEIDHRDRGVVALAHSLAGGGRRATIARMIAWVHGNLTKQTSTNLASASQILAARVGDCTEHTALFVALARAAGIPARAVSGLVYGGDEVGGFAWHAWAEVELEGRWHPVDPSWGESVANASHIALGRDGASDWLALLGDLEIEVHRVETGVIEAL